MNSQLLLGLHCGGSFTRQGRSVKTDVSLRHRGLAGNHSSSSSFLQTVGSLVLLHDGLVRGAEGVGLQQRALVTFLVGGADGVRSVRHWRSRHSLDQPSPARPWCGATAAGQINLGPVRSLGSLAARGASRPQEERVLGGEAAVLGGDARQSQWSNHRVVCALKLEGDFRERVTNYN